MSTTSPSKRNLLPARVKPKILMKTAPIASNAICTHVTFNTPTAINSCKESPIPTVFQLMALRFELNRNAIRMSTAMPSMPRHKLLMLNPPLGTISAVFSRTSLYVTESTISTARESWAREGKTVHKASRRIQSLVFIESPAYLVVRID